MRLYSKYIKREEFEKCEKQIEGTGPLLPIEKLLFEGLVRASFFEGNCFSLQGVYPLTKEIGDAWMISNKVTLKTYPLTAHKSARTVIEYAFKEFNFKSIQIQVPDDFHVKWCESMGFKKTIKIENRVFLSIIK